MALIDIKKYFYTMQNQYFETKATLADFNEAFKNGYITEDKLQTIKEDIMQVEQNYQRLVYIMYLWELPVKKKKQDKKRKQEAKLLKALTEVNATEEAVINENDSALTRIRNELTKLKETTK